MPTQTGPYALAVSLTFYDPSMGSDKEYHAVLLSTSVEIRYGRRHTPTSTASYSFDSQEKAAAKFWSILRDKTGKGYRVADAYTLDSVRLTQLMVRPRFGDDGRLLDPRHTMMAQLVEAWIRMMTRRLRSGQAADQPQPAAADRVRTDRTARQGRTVILALADPDCDPDVLFEAALAAPAERFLWHLATSHPNCPEEAKVGRALLAMTD